MKDQQRLPEDATPRRPDEERGRDSLPEDGAEKSNLRPLSLPARLVILTLGWLLLAIGIAGLALPGIQGILTIVFGLALLSVASETAHRLLRFLFRPWPRAWKKVSALRDRLHLKLDRLRPRSPRRSGNESSQRRQDRDPD